MKENAQLTESDASREKWGFYVEGCHVLSIHLCILANVPLDIDNFSLSETIAVLACCERGAKSSLGGGWEP